MQMLPMDMRVVTMLSPIVLGAILISTNVKVMTMPVSLSTMSDRVPAGMSTSQAILSLR